VTSGLLDTGIFIAHENARELGELPDLVAVSVVTIGELELGVLAADDDDVRARRADTLALAREFDPIPISEAVMTACAHLIIDCRRAGLQRAVRLTKALIAATAIARGLPVITQGAGFDDMAAAHPRLRVRKV
jgi:predicted nucleic acid-binding protein